MRKPMVRCYGLILIAFAFALTLWGPRARADARPPVRIGLPSFTSGTGAALGIDLVNGFELYLKQIGDHVGDRKIETFREDTEGKPSVAIGKIKELVLRDKVDLIFGVLNAGVAYAVADYITAAKIPFFVNSGADSLTQQQANPYIFRITSTNSQLVYPLADWVYHKMGKRRAIAFGADYPGGYEHVRSFEREFKADGGSVAATLWAPMGTSDFAPYLTSIKNADVLYGFFFGGDAIRLLKQYQEYGLKNKIPVVGSNLADDTILPALGDAGVGVITAELYSPTLDTPANKAFLAAYEAAFKRVPSQYAELGYTGARIVATAIAAVHGDVENKAAFLQALRQVKFTDAPRGPVRFDRYQQAIMNVYIRKVVKRNGTYQNTVIDTIPNVSQFWHWQPEDYLKTTKYVR